MSRSSGVILDLSDVDYLDSAGFDALDQKLARGVVAVVISPGGVLRKAAEIMCVPYHDSVEAARTAAGLAR